MTVQVLYKNKVKSSNSSVIALFAEDKFQIKNGRDFLSKNETSYVEKILKNRKNTKENIISLNINEKTTLILISLKKDLKGCDVENLGAEFYNFTKKNLFNDVSIITKSLKIINEIGYTCGKSIDDGKDRSSAYKRPFSFSRVKTLSINLWQQKKLPTKASKPTSSNPTSQLLWTFGQSGVDRASKSVQF